MNSGAGTGTPMNTATAGNGPEWMSEVVTEAATNTATAANGGAWRPMNSGAADRDAGDKTAYRGSRAEAQLNPPDTIQWASLSVATPATMSPAPNQRPRLFGSPKNQTPIRKVPAAPMPVHTA
jgi:hypothetical protein